MNITMFQAQTILQIRETFHRDLHLKSERNAKNTEFLHLKVNPYSGLVVTIKYVVAKPANITT